MSGAESAPSQPGDWWGDLVFSLSMLAALANALILFFMANWASVPEHRTTPDSQVQVAAEAAAAAALPFWGLLFVVVVAGMACFIAQLRDRQQIAMRLAAVQLLPVVMMTLVFPLFA